MHKIEISTTVFVEKQQVFDFVYNFPQFRRYTEYINNIEQYGSGDKGTAYDIHLTWWKLTYTARTKVTEKENPEVIEWKVIKDFTAFGEWKFEDVTEQKEIPDEYDAATEVTLSVSYERDSLGPEMVDIPRFVKFEKIVDKVINKVVNEGQVIVQRIIQDLEGQRREVELDVTRSKK